MLWSSRAGGAHFPLEVWVDEPDVELVDVVFCADWCEPYKKAAPKWEALRKRCFGQGLKRVVVDIGKKAQARLELGDSPRTHGIISGASRVWGLDHAIDQVVFNDTRQRRSCIRAGTRLKAPITISRDADVDHLVVRDEMAAAVDGVLIKDGIIIQGNILDDIP